MKKTIHYFIIFFLCTIISCFNDNLAPNSTLNEPVNKNLPPKITQEQEGESNTPKQENQPHIKNQVVYNNLSVLEKVFNSRTIASDSDPNTFLTKSGKEQIITAWYLSKAERDSLVDKLYNAYLEKPNHNPLDPRDKNIIAFIKKHIGGHYMAIPQLEFMKYYKMLYIIEISTPIYKITGWNIKKIDENNLKEFLLLFLAGAHFNIINENQLLDDIKSSPASMLNSMHSHFEGTTPYGRVYPNITWATRDPAPIVSALLIDLITYKKGSDEANNGLSAGTFFQLEGWPVHADSSAYDKILHGMDYIAHKNYLWNISTYGLSPYSEKRGTSIFITESKPTPQSLNSVAKKIFPDSYTDYAEEKRW